jgi:hypothetical protein
MVALLSSDVLEQMIDAGNDAPTLAVATDVPVHVDLIKGSHGTIALTPFIRLWQSLGGGAQTRLAERVGSITERHAHGFATLRRSVDAFNRGQTADTVRLLGGPIAQGDGGRGPDIPPAVLLGFAIKQQFEPLGRADAVEEGRQELYELVAAAANRSPHLLVGENKVMWGRGLGRHRADVLNETVVVLGDPDPIIAACAAEELVAAGQVDQFRIMRDDFEILKTRFLDIFELGSITVAYLSRVANIAQRGDPSAYARDPRPLSLAKALRTKAETREAWLTDLPVAQALFGPVNRRWRNLIGHHLIRNDLATGRLILNDGHEENYLSFLTSYLSAVRLTHYLTEAVIVLTRLDETVTMASHPDR